MNDDVADQITSGYGLGFRGSDPLLDRARELVEEDFGAAKQPPKPHPDPHHRKLEPNSGIVWGTGHGSSTKETP